MNKCFQRVSPKKPPRDIYTRLGAFVFGEGLPTDAFKRKLTAILSADVEGYSRLMGEDEAETVNTLTAYRKIVSELIQKHRRAFIDFPWYNTLTQFARVVDAVGEDTDDRVYLRSGFGQKNPQASELMVIQKTAKTYHQRPASDGIPNIRRDF